MVYGEILNSPELTAILRDSYPVALAFSFFLLIIGWFFWFKVKPNYRQRNKGWLRFFWYSIAWLPVRNKEADWETRYGGIGLVAMLMSVMIFEALLLDIFNIGGTGAAILILIPIIIFIPIIILTVLDNYRKHPLKKSDNISQEQEQTIQNVCLNRKDYIENLKKLSQTLEETISGEEANLAVGARNALSLYCIQIPPMDYLMETKALDWVTGNPLDQPTEKDSLTGYILQRIGEHVKAGKLHEKLAIIFSIVVISVLCLYGLAVLIGALVVPYPSLVLGLILLTSVLAFNYMNIYYAIFHYRCWKISTQIARLYQEILRKL